MDVKQPSSTRHQSPRRRHSPASPPRSRKTGSSRKSGNPNSKRVQARRRSLIVLVLMFCGISFFMGSGAGAVLANLQQQLGAVVHGLFSGGHSGGEQSFLGKNGRPLLSPLPEPKEIWTCEVVVIGGSLGGVAAASHAMQSGATTCLIELTPWLGGQISSQGVSAVDESRMMQLEQTFSKSWVDFKRLIKQQTIQLPDWTGLSGEKAITDINSCWVAKLCFPPKVGAIAAQKQIEAAIAQAPQSRWSVRTAFKGAEFDETGQQITAIYAVQRIPRDPNHTPQGHLSREITSWYTWDADAVFDKVPIRLQPPEGKPFIVVDATDTGELVGWAGVPSRLGSESLATTGERYASRADNSDCTQAFTYPFVITILDDQGGSLAKLAQMESQYPKDEHRDSFDLQGFPMFDGHGFFNYRRIVSTQLNDPYYNSASPGDMTLVNWNKGNDWIWMDPPLILTDDELTTSGQRQNWLGGVSTEALAHAENHALIFAHWLLETQATPKFPLTYLAGSDAPMGTASGLSMVPYIREGRRIVGRRAYGQRQFAIREADLRQDMQGGRDFSPTAIAATHYDVDIHGCRYWDPSRPTGEAASAPTQGNNVRLVKIPLESLIPQSVDNLLIGGKGIAVTHIANAVTRVHYSEWSIGSAAGAIAGWLVQQAPSGTTPTNIVPNQLIPQLRQHLASQGVNSIP